MESVHPAPPVTARLCKSPTLTPARLAACRANARKSAGPRTARGKARSSLNSLKHGRYAGRLIRTLERAREREGLKVYWQIVGRISLHFRVNWEREKRITERLAREVWCGWWKSVGGGGAKPRSDRRTRGSENNVLFRIQIKGNARGSALKFVFRRRRRRPTARLIRLMSLAELQTLWTLLHPAWLASPDSFAVAEEQGSAGFPAVGNSAAFP